MKNDYKICDRCLISMMCTQECPKFLKLFDQVKKLCDNNDTNIKSGRFTENNIKGFIDARIKYDYFKDREYSIFVRWFNKMYYTDVKC